MRQCSPSNFRGLISQAMIDQFGQLLKDQISDYNSSKSLTLGQIAALTSNISACQKAVEGITIGFNNFAADHKEQILKIIDRFDEVFARQNEKISEWEKKISLFLHQQVAEMEKIPTLELFEVSSRRCQPPLCYFKVFCRLEYRFLVSF